MAGYAPYPHLLNPGSHQWDVDVDLNVAYSLPANGPAAYSATQFHQLPEPVAAPAHPTPEPILSQADLDSLLLIDSLCAMPSSLWEQSASVVQPAQPHSTGSGSGEGAGTASCAGHASTGMPGTKRGSATGRYSNPEARARKQEQQRQYRQRCKQKKVAASSGMEAAERALQAARQERQELLIQQATMLKLQQYREDLIGILQEPAAGMCIAGVTSDDSPATVLTGPTPVLCLEAVADGTMQPGYISALLDAAVDEEEDQQAQHQTPSPQPPASVSQPERLDSPPAHETDGLPAKVRNIILSCLPERLFAKILVPSQNEIKRMVETVTPVTFVARDRTFRSLLRAALDEWQIGSPTGKRRVERRLKMLWFVRGNAAALMAEMRPDALAEVLQIHLLPAPRHGQLSLQQAGECPLVHPMLPPVVEQLGITSQQRSSIMVAWQQYKARTAASRKSSRDSIVSMSVAACRAPLSGNVEPLARLMQDYVSSLDAVGQLAALPREEVVAWTHLSLDVYKALTPLQCTKLLLGLSPYMPDCVQLCTLLQWQDEQRYADPLARAGLRHDSAHLLAGAPLKVM